MYYFKKHTTLSLYALILCSVASTLSSIAQANTFTEHPDYADFISQAAKAAIAPEFVDEVMQQVNYKQNVLKVMSQPGEHKEWYEYYPSLINQQRINRGVQFAAQYQTVLTRAEQEYGVSQAIILGILGVETAFGANKGNFRVVDALATLAFFDTKRRPYFTNELISFLALAQHQSTDPLLQKSSYAGAIGYPQFMPTSIAKYAVDYNHDGVIDLSNSPADAIGSVANYLAKHDWQPHAPIAIPANFTGVDDTLVISKDLTMPVTEISLEKQGLRPLSPIAENTLVSGIRHQTFDGPAYWITFKNFQVITTYNKSRLYATAVWQLGEAVQSARNRNE